MAVFCGSGEYGIDPVLKHGFIGMLYSCHGLPLTPHALYFRWDGALSDTETGLFLMVQDDRGAGGKCVVFSETSMVSDLVFHKDGQLSVRFGEDYLTAMPKGGLEVRRHQRNWEKFQLREVRVPLSSLPPEQRKPIEDIRIGALCVLFSIGVVFRLRTVHGGLITAGKRGDGCDDDAKVLLFRPNKPRTSHSFSLDVIAPDDAKTFLSGKKVSAEVRIGTGGVAKVAILVTDTKHPKGWYLRADKNGVLTERMDQAQEWENFVVEVTTQSVEAGYRELDAAKVIPKRGSRPSGGKIASGSVSASASSVGTNPRGSSGGFDYSAALKGASEVKVAAKATAVQPASSTSSQAAGAALVGSKQRAIQKAGASSNGNVESAREVKSTKTGSVIESAVAGPSGARRAKKKNRNGKKKGGAGGGGSAGTAANVTAKTPAKPSGSSSGSGKPEEGKPTKSVVREVAEEVDEPIRPRDPCYACGRNLEGTITTAMGHRYHAACFICTFCRRPLTGGTFREDRGRAMCDLCYKTKVAPRCSRCSEGILGTVTTALGKTWHPSCFLCTRCGCAITAEKFYLMPHKPNEPFCGTCHGMKTFDKQQFNLARVQLPFKS